MIFLSDTKKKHTHTETHIYTIEMGKRAHPSIKLWREKFFFMCARAREGEEEKHDRISSKRKKIF